MGGEERGEEKNIGLIFTMVKKKYLPFGEIQRIFRPANAVKWSSMKLFMAAKSKDVCQLGNYYFGN